MNTPTPRPFVLLALLFAASPLAAQQTTVPGPAELDAAIEAHEARADEDRAVVSRVLDNAAVQRAAGDAGLDEDLERARAALPTLASGPLTHAANHARVLERQLAGGQSVVLSTTTIIIVLLIIIIILVI